MTVYVSRHAAAAAIGAPGRAGQPHLPATGRATVYQFDPPLLTFVWQRVLSQPAQRGGRR
ncbi:multiple cyclophane-containing RiPP AmcA [Micromonospora sp. 4G55]|uniref:multiple cyclophane-containing RiPP AmcA n=1 Tax=Micromonospora sp. 4G55 TaxID=2806102 RepID=UPI00272E99F9|nr:multiple cyclophane-containing RiPP AmcA [Micromonospora sp. 4G55]